MSIPQGARAIREGVLRATIDCCDTNALMLTLIFAFFASARDALVDAIDLAEASGVVTEHETASLWASAPTYLNEQSARENLIAAHVAAERFHVDRSLLLSIAWHESRYVQGTATVEQGHRVSCGIMTPTPRERCPKNATLLDEYLAGAKHLREWLDATSTRRSALLGYAGGGRLINACAAGPVLRPGSNPPQDLCRTPEVFLYRAKLIAGAKSATPSS